MADTVVLMELVTYTTGFFAIIVIVLPSVFTNNSLMMACSCEKGQKKVSKGCGRKIRAWRNIDNDVTTCKAGISGHRKGERH